MKKNRYEKLAAAYKDALEQTHKAMAEVAQDGGTCNLDYVRMELPNWRHDNLRTAFAAAGLPVPRKSAAGFWMMPGCFGQGWRNTKGVEHLVVLLRRAGYPDTYVAYVID